MSSIQKMDYLFGKVPSEPFNVVIDNIQKLELQKKLLCKADQVLVNKQFEGQIKEAISSQSCQNTMKKAKIVTFDTLESGLSELNNDALTIVFSNRKFNNLYKTAQMAARFSSKMHVQTCQQSIFTLPKGTTTIQAPAEAKLLIFPTHGKSDVNVNGENLISDFGGEILEFKGKKFNITCDMPVGVVVEGKCDQCEKK